MTTLDPEALCHELEKRGLDWADKDAAYHALDDLTKTILSECIADLNEHKSAAADEVEARRSQKFREHLAALNNARRAANRAKVNYSMWQAYMELLRTQEATKRAEINLR